jgi:hypothetical protein
MESSRNHILTWSMRPLGWNTWPPVRSWDSNNCNNRTCWFKNPKLEIVPKDN